MTSLLPDPWVRPSDGVPGTGGLVDRHGRVATDLRVSLTDRCNLRCTYCMPPEGLAWLPKVEVLTDEDEARYGYIAAINTSTLTDGTVLELGGGSMQLIRVEDSRAADLSSFGLGAVRLTERFLPGGGPTKTMPAAAQACANSGFSARKP